MTELALAIAGNDYQMTEDRFWYIVDKLNWARLSQNKKLNTDVARANVISLFDLDHRGISELRQITSLAWKLLDEYIGMERNPAGGDDSHSDLLHHIIGLGKDEFYACLKDYERIEKRGKAPYGSPEGYSESFVYILPYETDVADPRKEFDVTIEATVRKTIRVKAYEEDEAIQEAHSLFTTACEEGEQEKYEEEMINCEEVFNV